jgi:hypothetical protein
MSTKNSDDREQLEPAGEEAHLQHQGAPAGARQHVRNDTTQGGVARPAGAAQNSGGALASNQEQGDEPGRGAD